MAGIGLHHKFNHKGTEGTELFFFFVPWCLGGSAIRVYVLLCLRAIAQAGYTQVKLV